MKALFYILSLLTIVAAAYFSNVNKENFTEQQTSRVDTINLNRKVSANADDMKKQLDDESNKLREAKSALAEVEQSIASLESKARELSRELAEIDTELEEQLAKIKAGEDALDEAKKALAALGLGGNVNFDNIDVKIKELEDKRKVLIADIEELDNNIDAATNQVAKNRTEIARLDSRKGERDARIAANAKESVITAVDQEWGFVVIGAGSSSGFAPQNELIVKRDGRIIAEVRPSSIEASQTIAEIDFDTVVPGVRLQPGDRVIIAKPVTN
jgi:septal ring factor EnvC (AmiA/AmiB activator)